MAKRRKNIVVEDLSQDVLNDVRDTERRVFNRLQPRALNELQRRGVTGPTGNYNRGFFAEVDPDSIALYMGNDAPHAYLVEFGTGPRTTKAGENRGEMPKTGRRRGIVRKAALAFRRTVFDAVEEALRRV